MTNKIKQIVLLLGDVFILHLALFFALYSRYGFDYANFHLEKHWYSFIFIFLIWILVFYIFNLYNLQFAADRARFSRIALSAILLSSLLTVAFFYINPFTDLTPKTNLALFISIFTILFVGWRKIFNHALKTYLPKNNLMLIAKERRVNKLVEFLSNKPQLGFKAAIVINELLSKEELEEVIRKKNIKTIVVDAALENVQEWRYRLFHCLHFNLNITDLATFYEKSTGKVSLETITHTWFLDNFNEGDKKYFNRLKRAIDLTFAIILFVLSLPVWSVVIFILSSAKGPVFFIQKRVGKNYREFNIIKFRTMKDHQITKIGRWLRKTRIDEIPQLVNIIRNDMSFIGPRPEQPHLVTQLKKQIPFYQERLLVKPGLSGWDQISETYHSSSYLDSFEKLQYDLFYIKNRSLYLDFSICLKTISTVLNHKGR